MRSALKRAYQTVVPFAIRAGLRDAERKLRDARAHLGRSLSRSQFLKTGKCNVCGLKELSAFEVAAFPAFDFYRCGACEYVFVWPPPDTAHSAYYEAVEMPDFGDPVWNREWLKAIEAYAGHKGRLLELGFGDAAFLKLAYAEGWETYGAELSVPLVGRASEELKLPNIHLGTLESMNREEFFDVVCGYSFLEHVPDPRRMLEEIFRSLRRGGVVAVVVPNLAGIYHRLAAEVLGPNDPLKITWCPPDHLSYFNKKNLRMLFDSVGFTDVRDESRLTARLWLQFGPQIGPEVTSERLKQLSSENRRDGDDHREEVKKLIVERMTWQMLTDLVELEAALGAEGGVFLLARRP
jgi:SAM-dependent methyltransferase